MKNTNYILSKEMLMRTVRGACEVEPYFYFECSPVSNASIILTFHGYRPFDLQSSPYATEYLFLASNHQENKNLISIEVSDMEEAMLKLECFLLPYEEKFKIFKEI